MVERDFQLYFYIDCDYMNVAVEKLILELNCPNYFNYQLE